MIEIKPHLQTVGELAPGYQSQTDARFLVVSSRIERPKGGRLPPGREAPQFGHLGALTKFSKAVIARLLKVAVVRAMLLFTPTRGAGHCASIGK